MLAQTMWQAERAGLEIELLPSWYDVDDGSSLHRLSEELLGQQSDPHQYPAPYTKSYLNELSVNRGDDLWAPGSGLARSSV